MDTVPVVTETSERPKAEILLDGPVSRTAYRLGAGDALTVAIFGDFNQTHTVQVGPEGTLLLPGLGTVNVLGLNLVDAEDRVRRLVFRYYRNVDVGVNLLALRSFKVFVLGSVAAPGVRQATSATRVSEVVPLTSSNGALHRNLVLRRASGDSLRVDLARFIQLGDLSQNPALREGDVLLVPGPQRTVQVLGSVTYPGVYNFSEEETLAELLIVANGGTDFPPQAADSIRLSRVGDNDDPRVRVFAINEALGAEGRDFPLEPFDAVFVPQVGNFMRQPRATIEGQVHRPGVYPIRPDTTTVRELVALAGGFTAQASLATATLRRQSGPVPSGANGGLEEVPSGFLSHRERRLLQARAHGDARNVVIDFRRLFLIADDAYDQTLRSGDVLSVPELRNEVLVSGAVLDPGIVPHTPGAPLDRYLALAGGYGRNADARNLVVLKASTGARVDREDVRALDPGDEIVVPFKEPRTALERVQMIQGIIGTISSFVLTVYGLGRLF